MLSRLPAEAQIDVEGEDGSSINRELDHHRKVVSKHTQSSADFSSPEVDTLREEPTQSLERHNHFLEAHAQADGRAPLDNVPRRDSVNLNLGLQADNPNGKGDGPSQVRLTEMGLGPKEGAILFETFSGVSDSERPNASPSPAISPEEPNLNYHIPQAFSAPIQRQLSGSGVNLSNISHVPMMEGYSQRKRVGRDFYLRGGCKRFLSQKCKRRAPKPHLRRGKSADGRIPMQACQIDTGGAFRSSDSRVDLNSEVNSNPSYDPIILEGLKMWDFGKKLGLSSSQDDVIVVKNLAGIPCEDKGLVLEKAISV